MLSALCLSLSLSLSFTHTPVSARPLYIVYFRIGSLSTRDPPPSLLSYGPIVVFSPSLPPSFLAAPLLLKTPQHTPILRFLRTERACDNLLGRSSGPRLVRPVLTRCQPFPFPPPFRSPSEALSHQPLDRPSPDSPRAPPYSYHPFFSFLYLIAALFMPGPANKHMNARAFSQAPRP